MAGATAAVTWTLYNTDCLAGLRELPDNSVQTCITSPPYWGLRDYGTATWEAGDPACQHDAAPWTDDPGDLPEVGRNALAANAAKWVRRTRGVCRRCGAVRVDGQLGLEPTPEEYVARLVEVFREVRRVLRKDGTLWLNLGDSYASTAPGTRNAPMPKGSRDHPEEWANLRPKTPDGLKPKDLVGIPWRVAFALQADGWYLRSDIIWHKPNPMPESVTDRPTKAHEYLFLLAKSERYYYDAEAIREQATTHLRDKRYGPGAPGRNRIEEPWNQQGPYKPHKGFKSLDTTGGRNRRSVWTIPTQPFPEAHFATFPEDLVEPCVLAGSSPRACPECGAPWRRRVETGGGSVGRSWHDHQGDIEQGQRVTDAAAKGGHGYYRRTVGRQPTCSCEGNDGSGRSLVLDPFAGAGTTLLVAERFGRDSIGFELNPEYCDITRRRLAAVQTQLL